MKPFDFVVPTSLDDALTALDGDRGDVRPIAGGQSLLLEMKERRRTPSRLVALSALPELCRWGHADGGELVVGAGTSYATLSEAELPGWHGVLAAVAGDLADRPVRTMGTIGGALCQADPRFDMPVLVVGLDAQLQLASARESRAVPAADLFSASGGLDLRPGEIVVAVRVPALARYTAAAFEKVRHRMFDAAIASAVCALRLDGEGLVSEARLTIGAVASAPILVDATSLVGRSPAEMDIAAAARAATQALAAAVTPDTRQKRYQHELVGVVARRAIDQAREQARS